MDEELPLDEPRGFGVREDVGYLQAAVPPSMDLKAIVDRQHQERIDNLGVDNPFNVSDEEREEAQGLLRRGLAFPGQLWRSTVKGLALAGAGAVVELAVDRRDGQLLRGTRSWS